MPETQSELITVLKEFHRENVARADRLQTLLLDFNERLAINEMSMKNADGARTLLLTQLDRAIVKIDNLGELPMKVTTMASSLEELKTTVKAHEATFNRMEGGLTVAKIAWGFVAAGIALVVSTIVSYLMKKV